MFLIKKQIINRIFAKKSPKSLIIALFEFLGILFFSFSGESSTAKISSFEFIRCQF